MVLDHIGHIADEPMDVPVASARPGALVEPRVLLVGRPGSGKGTQGERLSARLDVHYLSTGDLLRRHIAANTSLGRSVERLVLAGELVPDELIAAIVMSCIGVGGYVLDGFPRTVEQAAALSSLASTAPNLVIELVVSPAVVISRLAGRNRSDDDIEVARRRLDLYDTETAPMLAGFERDGILRRVDGDGTVAAVEAEVWRETMRALEGTLLVN